MRPVAYNELTYLGTIMIEIKGQKDEIMLLLRSLRTESGRLKGGRFIVEGTEMIRRAVQYGAGCESLIVSTAFRASEECDHLVELAAGCGAGMYVCSSGLIGKMLEAKPTPDCVAIVLRSPASLGEILDGDLVIMVEGGENADNLGMLLRSADAAGVSGVVLAAGTTDPYSRRAVRGSRGAVFSVPICTAGEAPGVVARAREGGMNIVATSAVADEDYRSADYTGPTMLVVGNEHTGITEEVRKAADNVVRIPMAGKVHSLNISVAATLMLFEARRQQDT